MDSATEERRESWFATLLRVAIWPRSTMRRILDATPRRSPLPLVLLAIFALMLQDLDNAMFRAVKETPSLLFVMAGALILVGGLMLGLFYLFAWVATLVAKQLGGTGDTAVSRLALGWGFAPVIWSLLYRFPVACFALFGGLSAGEPAIRFSDKEFAFVPGRLGHGCGVAILMAVIELLFFIWWGVVASRTMAEAHRFSSWRGLATIVITMAAPIVIAIAALLTSIT